MRSSGRSGWDPPCWARTAAPSSDSQSRNSYGMAARLKMSRSSYARRDSGSPTIVAATCSAGRLALPVSEGLGHREVEPRLRQGPRHEDVRVDLAEHHRLSDRVTAPPATVDQEQPASLRVLPTHPGQQLHSADAGVRQLGRGQDQRDVPARVGQRRQLGRRPARLTAEHLVVRREPAPESRLQLLAYRRVVDGDEDDRVRHGFTLMTEDPFDSGPAGGLVPDTVSGPTVNEPCWESESSPAAAGSVCACCGTTTRWGCSPRPTSTSGPDAAATRCRSSLD